MRRVLIGLLGFGLLFIFFQIPALLPDERVDIYSKIKCCTCSEKFETCSCEHAVEIKAFIDGLLASKVTPEDIFHKLAAKFGLKIINDEKLRAVIEQDLRPKGATAQIVISPASVDLGRVSRKAGSISARFKVSNKGEEDLIIKNIKATCPCVKVALKVGRQKADYFSTEGSPPDWQRKIEPGKTAEFEFVLDLFSKYANDGKLLRHAVILSNDPVKPQLDVIVTAEVID